jgi:hypothetical protein
MLDRFARFGEAHREVSERHRDSDEPRPLIETTRHVLSESQRRRSVGRSIGPKIDLSLSEVQLKLFAQATALRGGSQCARSQAELCFRAVAPAVDQSEESALGGKPGCIQRVP